MLNRILGQHSSVLAMNELHYFGSFWDPERGTGEWTERKATRAAARLLARIHRGIWGGGPSESELTEARELLGSQEKRNWTPAAVFEVVLAAQASASMARYVTEQTPRNIFYARQLMALYGEARVLHIVRDPRAVLYSQRSRWRTRRLGGRQMPIWNVVRLMANYHPLTMTLLWKKAVEQGLMLQNHPRYRMVFFEELVQEPEKQVRQICRFLDLEFEDEMLKVPQIGSSHKAHTPERRGISADVADAWRNKLARGHVMLCERMAGPLMRRLGYEPYGQIWWYPATLGPLLGFPLHMMGVLISNPARAWIQFKALFGGRDES